VSKVTGCISRWWILSASNETPPREKSPTGVVVPDAMDGGDAMGLFQKKILQFFETRKMTATFKDMGAM
jgi:hypothetical protein